MRMKKGLSDSPKRYRATPLEKHSGRIGQPPKPTRKKAANVTISEDVLADAKKLGINLSQTLEDELRKRIKEEKTKRWQEENREAFESHNRFIEKYGIWSEKYRTW
jgi:antitoxin CcdA